MDITLTREQAYNILKIYLKNPNLLKHSLAAEATMKALYKRLTPAEKQTPEEEEKWGITGLLHDGDYELCKDHPEIHGVLLFEKVKDQIPKDVEHAIKSHNYEFTKVMPENILDWAITCCDQLTGLTVACALVLPDKKLSSLTAESIMKKMNDKAFAKGANRKSILLCEEKLNISLQEFVTITLTAMQGISDQLGL